jgi:hypothetical protein
MVFTVSSSALLGAAPGAALGAPARIKFYPFRAALSTGLSVLARLFDNALQRRL